MTTMTTTTRPTPDAFAFAATCTGVWQYMMAHSEESTEDFCRAAARMVAKMHSRAVEAGVPTFDVQMVTDAVVWAVQTGQVSMVAEPVSDVAGAVN